MWSQNLIFSSFSLWCPIGVSQPSDLANYGDTLVLHTWTSSMQMGEDWSSKGKGEVTSVWLLSTFSVEEGNHIPNTHHPLGSVLDPFLTLWLWHNLPCLCLRGRDTHWLTSGQTRDLKVCPGSFQSCCFEYETLVTVEICVLSDAQRSSEARREIEDFCRITVFSWNRIKKHSAGMASSKTALEQRQV